ncbi:MAG: c-type cytochrome [Deltaproteobacteria bacterium]|nr:MAG: c-type cytochrome [Deltaproteobacteria bacterium]
MPRSRPLIALTLLAPLTFAACDTAEDGLAPVTAAERLPGGSGTNTLLLGPNAFTPPLETLSLDEELAFYSGNAFFSQAWVQAPASTDARDGLGPMFNARSCGACHALDGRGRPPLADGEEILGLLFRLSVPGAAEDEAPHPDPVYGGQLQPFGLGGVPAEATPRITRELVEGHYDDGTPYTLERPRYAFDAPAYGALPDDLEVSPRVAPQVIGLGLLEAIPAAALLAREDPDDADGDGISGRAQVVLDPRTGAPALGRFGWKGDAPTLEAQTAGAFHGDMGLTSSLHPEPECTEHQSVCDAVASGGDPEVSDLILSRITDYLRFLAVPVRTRWDDAEVRRGKRLFTTVGCASCHVPESRTGDDAASPALAGQRIFPYTDLLLHDMGPDLADGRPVFRASGQEWKTPPLWGIGRIPAVNGHDRLLHDGRARGVAEAILWHGGEAEAARDAFKALTAPERDALIAFVKSL